MGGGGCGSKQNGTLDIRHSQPSSWFLPKNKNLFFKKTAEIKNVHDVYVEFDIILFISV